MGPPVIDQDFFRGRIDEKAKSPQTFYLIAGQLDLFPRTVIAQTRREYFAMRFGLSTDEITWQRSVRDADRAPSGDDCALHRFCHFEPPHSEASKFNNLENLNVVVS
jgi:hypothetical protein